MRIVGIRNRHVRCLRRDRRTRRWFNVGDRVFVAPGQFLYIGSERIDEGPATLVLHFQCASGLHVLREPERLSFYTTEALIRAVEYAPDGVSAVLIDFGELVTAPALLEAS